MNGELPGPAAGSGSASSDQLAQGFVRGDGRAEPGPQPPRTGDPAVDAALSRFAAAPTADLDRQADAAHELDEALRTRLADLGAE